MLGAKGPRFCVLGISAEDCYMSVTMGYMKLYGQ